MKKNLTQKIIENHLVHGEMKAGQPIGLKIDQTLTQDATGTLVMLEFNAMGKKRVETELSAQYVDHNLIQGDYKNSDDHLFLRSACKKFGLWYSQPGNGVSHPVHMERFGIPGKTLLGSDSHTCAAGSLGMLAIGTGGMEVTMAMMGEPFIVEMPRVMGVKLTGQLPDWVSAKDVILEMLRRHDVDGGIGKVIEYYGPGLEQLSAMDRHVIANMGAELGATTTVFPADEMVKRFLKQQEREDDFVEFLADEDCDYDEHDEINLSELEPLIAKPSSPGNVVPISEVAGEEIYQSYIGSSANPGMRDFAVPAMIVKGKRVPDSVSLDINPTSRQILENMINQGFLANLIRAGARLHQAGCNGCIGMGQAPASGRNSLRTVPRNFPGRSGTKEDRVFLCSPETAAASALKGAITDPRTLDMDYPRYKEPETISINREMLSPPAGESSDVELDMGPNIKPIPDFDALPDTLKGPVLLKVGDNISTDEILPAGANVLPFRSNVPQISEFCYTQVDEEFPKRAKQYQDSGFVIVGGKNYGQGSSREHAAIAPRYLGLRVVVAKEYARIHRKNLINFGVAPLLFKNPEDYNTIEQEDEIEFPNIKQALQDNGPLTLKIKNKNQTIEVTHNLTDYQKELVLAGGLINYMRDKQGQ